MNQKNLPKEPAERILTFDDGDEVSFSLDQSIEDTQDEDTESELHDSIREMTTQEIQHRVQLMGEDISIMVREASACRENCLKLQMISGQNRKRIQVGTCMYMLHAVMSHKSCCITHHFFWLQK